MENLLHIIIMMAVTAFVIVMDDIQIHKNAHELHEKITKGQRRSWW